MTSSRRRLLFRVLAAGAADRPERLLVLERRLEAAYSAALSAGAINATLGRSLLAHEREHVRGVELALEALGRRPPDREPSQPPDAVLQSRDSFARFALDLETRTVRAYMRVLSALDAPELLQPLGSMMTCGAQHGVALRHVLGRPPLPPTPSTTSVG